MRIVIVDDEPPAARALEGLCREVLGKRVEALKAYRSLTPARLHLADEPVDLLFLDIDLEGENGFDLLEQSVLGSFYTIVTSSHLEYAVRAFDFGVLDFLPKPIARERFEKALTRMEEVFGLRRERRRYLPVKSEDGLELVPVERLHHLESDRNYTLLHLDDGTSHRIRASLESVLRDLPPEYLRVHKSGAVRRSAIVRILQGPNNTFRLLLDDESSLPLSRSMYADLKAEFLT